MGPAADERFMRRALELAREGLYSAAPNPAVGCVVVRDGRIVGEGYHVRVGEPHAEVHALRAAGDAAHGATAYVTLEPCNHTGRTPPCVDALIEARIARVVAAMRDPNIHVAGGGLARLAGNGIACSDGVLETEARELVRGFASRMERGRPWVTVKVAASLDGRTALANGRSQWITGESARADVQRLRARACAIVTGVATVVADDPRLTVRDQTVALRGRAPMRVVLDTGLNTPPDARLLREPGRTLIVAAEDADSARAESLVAAGAELLRVQRRGARLDLDAVLSELARLSCNEVLVEAGPTLSGAVIEAGLADELVLYVAPSLLGDAGRGMFTMRVLEDLNQRIELRIVAVERIGDDIRITARPPIDSPATE